MTHYHQAFADALQDQSHILWHNKAMQIYHDNLYYGLLDALKSRYRASFDYAETAKLPILEWAKQYLHKFLPTSPIMAYYGDEFAEFISHKTDAPIIDLAKLENLITKSFHAVLEKRIDSMEYFQKIAEAELLNASFTCVADAYILETNHHILPLYQRQSIDAVKGAHYYLIKRPIDRVEIEAIPQNLYIALKSLMKGASMEQALLAGMEENPTEAAASLLYNIINTAILKRD